MRYMEINPRYRDFLAENGLHKAEDFLDLPGLIISGHPDRHVARVTLGAGPSRLAAYLKREHRVPWSDRLLNARAGFGLVSKSHREARVLRALREAGIGCPDWLAVGEGTGGRSFLLVRELTGALDLRFFLRDLAARPAAERRRFAQELGETLARLHNAGFDHPDLYSKHVLVRPGDWGICLLDCQRSRLRSFVPWKERCRELAALDATLAGELVSGAERVACLRAYLRACRLQRTADKEDVLRTAFHILRYEERLLRQRRIRELRQPPLATGIQSVIWQNGEALCLTPEFHSALRGQTPDWLDLAQLPERPRSLRAETVVVLPGGRQGLLVRRRESGILRGLWTWLHGRRPTSPELCKAGLLFRLQRHGVRTPRLLAFGQRQTTPWRVESFLLTEPVPGTIGLGQWLSDSVRAPATDVKPDERRRLIREAAAVVRRLHEAGCYLGTGDRQDQGAGCGLCVQHGAGERPAVVLGDIRALRTRRRPQWSLALGDLKALRHQFSVPVPGRTDQLRFLLRYLNLLRLTPDAKRLARSILRGGPQALGPGFPNPLVFQPVAERRIAG